MVAERSGEIRGRATQSREACDKFVYATDTTCNRHRMFVQTSRSSKIARRRRGCWIAKNMKPCAIPAGETHAEPGRRLSRLIDEGYELSMSDSVCCSST